MENVRIPWNDWKVVKQLGKGSYGTVYEIERNIGGLTDKAALKVISIPPDEQLIKTYRSEGYDDNSILKKCESYLQDTLNEYKLMRSLGGSANIVYCEDIAYLPKDAELGFDVFIRMELLTPFQDYISNSNFTEEDVIKLGKDLCKALALCETHGIVHRDVKPGNIFVTENGDFKLGDFGVARILEHATIATRIGTEKFMAPEVIKGKVYDTTVDLYSLGLVLYWLLNGRRMPFLQAGRVPTSQEEQDALSKRLSGDALPNPQEGSRALVDVVLKACEYEQERRYASAKEMLEALKHVSESPERVPPDKSEIVEPKPVSRPIPTQNKLVDDESKTNSWEEEKTVGRDFLDDNKESEFDEAEQKTLTPEWEEEKKNKEQKNQKDVKNYKNKTSHNTEIDNSSSKNEPVPVSETIPNTTKSKRFPPLLLFLIGGLIIIGAVVFAAIYSDSNNSSSSSSHLSSGSSTTIGGRTFETVTLGGIEWIVLAEEGNDTLLLSKDILEYKPYNEEYESVTWETCTLRSYLNGTWYEDTFGEEEKGKILTTNVVNSDNAVYGTPGGNDTKDKVFLLSMDEVERYFSSDDEKVAKYNGEADWWWLRSPGYDGEGAAIVYSGGSVYYYGYDVDGGGSGIRPALWVNLNS